LILAAVFATIGLFILLPRKHFHADISWGGSHKYKHDNTRNKGHHPNMRIEDGGSDNNPSISVKFGGVSRYLHSDSLETAQLYCSFGALEVYFDQAQLSPNGATASLNCSFGATTLFVPKHWQIIDELNCTLGGIEIDNRFAAPTEDPPKLTLTGSVSLGGIEVRYV
jgi:hypothetical protein